jgi:predicted RNase H-like nuclease (RuvC/YqgF family)
MNLKIEDYLHKIDSLFKSKEQKEIYMIYIMIVGGIFAFSYLLFWDSSFENFEKTRGNVQRLSKQIAQDKQYLQKNPEIKVSQLDREIKKINNEMIMHKKNNAYIKHKIEAISSLIYDESAWGEYLDSITTNAQKYNIKINEITNEYAELGSSFGHILDITVSAKGKFKNTIKFINSMEQSDLVVDIHDFNLTAKNTLNSNFQISVWGIKY